MKFLLIGLIAIVSSAYACDIIVHVKSATTKKFSIVVMAPNGEKSERWTFTRRLQKETFQQRANECTIGEWSIELFNDAGVSTRTVRVTLDGTGRVLYEVNDNLELTQVERQGAICTGQCAPLGTAASARSRPSSPIG